MQIPGMAPPPTPWFREPGPWLLMLGPFLVIVAGCITAAIAFHGADGLVAEDYYKQGLAINRVLEREQRAVALHVRGTAWYAAQTDRIRVQVAADTSLPAVLTLRLAHPTRSGMDQIVMLRATSPGIYEAPLTMRESKHWLVTVDGGDWRLAADWDGQSALALGAASAPAAAR